MSKVVAVVSIIALVGIIFLVATRSRVDNMMSEEKIAEDVPGAIGLDAEPDAQDKEILLNSCQQKKFIVTNPNNELEKRVSPSFQYVSWDGGQWVATIIGDTFYIRKNGSSRIFKTKFINVLRFRSMEWQVAFIPEENKFMLSRLNGITGMLFKDLDIFDWGYHSYIVTPV